MSRYREAGNDCEFLYPKMCFTFISFGMMKPSKVLHEREAVHFLPSTSVLGCREVEIVEGKTANTIISGE